MHTPQTEVIAMLEDRELFRFVLPPGECVIGRAQDMQVRLHSDRVSRRPAQLTISYYSRCAPFSLGKKRPSRSDRSLIFGSKPPAQQAKKKPW